jgi:HK97 gp10 family phage protein
MTEAVKLDTTRLDQMIRTTPEKIADVVMKTAWRILGDARMVTPRDPQRPPQDPERQVTGALKAENDVVKKDEKGHKVNVEYYQEYAIYQELGAPANNMPARPFLTPAVEKNAEQFQKDLAKAVKP